MTRQLEIKFPPIQEMAPAGLPGVFGERPAGMTGFTGRYEARGAGVETDLSHGRRGSSGEEKLPDDGSSPLEAVARRTARPGPPDANGAVVQFTLPLVAAFFRDAIPVKNLESPESPQKDLDRVSKSDRRKRPRPFALRAGTKPVAPVEGPIRASRNRTG